MSMAITRFGATDPALPATLPSLTSALSRRRALFGAVALAAAPAAVLPAMASPAVPDEGVTVMGIPAAEGGTMTVLPSADLHPNDLYLIAVVDALEALQRDCDAHTAAHRGGNRSPADEDEFDALVDGFSPLEEAITETPADTMAGVLAKARAGQIRTVRDYPAEVMLSLADDMWRLFGGDAA